MSILMIALLLCTLIGILTGFIVGFVLGYDAGKSHRDYKRNDIPVAGMEDMPKTKCAEEWRDDLENPE